MKNITSVAFEWSADDIQRHIENLSSDYQVIAESRIESQHEFLENLIEYHKYDIIHFINELIINAINDEIR